MSKLLEVTAERLVDLALQVPWWGWAVVTGLFLCWLTAKPVRHAWRIRKAEWVLKQLKVLAETSGPAAQFGFLRSKAVDPFTFEEAILSALKERKLKIRRNHRYTGDGGIDGKAWRQDEEVVDAMGQM